MSNECRQSFPKLIWSLLRPRWFGVMFVLLLIPVGSLLELAPPFLLKRVVDSHLKVGVAEGIPLLALLYVLAFVALQSVSFLQTYVAAAVGQKALRDLRLRLFRHIAQLLITYFDRTPTGDTISRCTADVDAVGMLFSATLLGVFSQLVRIGGVLIAMVVLSPRLALIALIAVPVVAFVSHIFRVKMLAAERAIRLHVGETNAHLQEVLTGMEVIRAFAATGTFEHRFRRIQDGFLSASDRSGLLDAVFSPLIETLKAVSIAMLLWYATRPSVFLSWGITLGTLAAFVQLLDNFFRPITALGQEYQTVQQAVAGVERIAAIFALPVEGRPYAAPVPLPQGQADLEVVDVTYSYLSGQPVLHGVSFTVSPGEQITVVGATGAGKSTLMHLIAGLYAPDTGRVRIGGIDPRSLTPAQRRRLIGVVPQQVHIFDGTVLDNLRLGDEEMSEDAAWRVLELANAKALIQGLPDGLHTHLGASGFKLSVGQRQLLALARALVSNPSLLLLDEATSNIDAETERLIREGLVRSSTGRTTLTVAHRLTTAQEADRVVVMANGRIIEEGHPDELVAVRGWYAGMLELQRLGWMDVAR